MNARVKINCVAEVDSAADTDPSEQQRCPLAGTRAPEAVGEAACGEPQAGDHGK